MVGVLGFTGHKKLDSATATASALTWVSRAERFSTAAARALVKPSKAGSFGSSGGGVGEAWEASTSSCAKRRACSVSMEKVVKSVMSY